MSRTSSLVRTPPNLLSPIRLRPKSEEDKPKKGGNHPKFCFSQKPRPAGDDTAGFLF